MKAGKTRTLAIGIVFILLISSSIVSSSGNLRRSSSSFVTSAIDSLPMYTINQTLSDEAQLNTISFDALAFLTGSLGADSFFPPGKVADFWGFQYLRDNDPSQMGHNTDFLTKAANNMLYILNNTERQQLVSLAENQVDSINEYAYDRFVLMKAFRRLLDGDVPSGSTGLNLTAVKAYSAQLYQLDGQISLQRATIMGNILKSLNQSQRAYLDLNMVGKGMLSWPNVTDQLDPHALNLTNDEMVAVMTYSSDLFSWYAGSLDADVYFCPERQGTYFGSFYMKDAPAMGNPNYTIPSNLTGDAGRIFLSKLTPTQAQLVADIVNLQKSSLLMIVDTRRAVATQLRRFIIGEASDNATVQDLMMTYGELDGEIIYNYATSFAVLSQTLSSDQKTQITELRTQICNCTPSGAFLYSTVIGMPSIPNTDFLFAEPLPSGTIPGDVNGDHQVSLIDLVILASAYNSHGSDYHYQGESASNNWNPNADIDGNNIVGLSDLVILAQHYGEH